MAVTAGSAEYSFGRQQLISLLLLVPSAGLRGYVLLITHIH
jgi:hypothetical protein